MTEHQTLVMQSGHPLGLFKSSPDNPRVIITNGLMVASMTIRKIGRSLPRWGVFLRTDDCGWMDVYWSSGDCTRHL